MKDKVQEAAEKFKKERHSVYDEAINTDLLIDFARYQANEGKQSID